MNTLTRKQARFVAEYLVDLNGKQAAIRAGYSERTAESQASRLLSKAKVAEAVAAGNDRRLQRVEAKADDVLTELIRLAKSDIRTLFDETGRMKPIHELSDEAAATLASVEILREKTTRSGADSEVTVEESVRKVRLWDKPRALELLARHLGLLRDVLAPPAQPMSFTLNIGVLTHPQTATLTLPVTGENGNGNGSHG